MVVAEAEAEEAVAAGVVAEVVAEVVAAATTLVDTAAGEEGDTEEEDATGGELRRLVTAIRLIFTTGPSLGLSYRSTLISL